ncbi:hypothetical protein [Pseudochrobactrum saccharolyticum]|uniref:Uncharacterized protein n=1 Tax=Pseudochrobactrum saccharolyticum TaxID=354352 RepID=A0A7W8AJ45_9HYPH|nr:hypothetical protein [Pseudochrobactrum saccharolyticum]KAB0538083.1 hypothetical protein F7P81_10160 [Pseudochrobactrum saccharolyticum]MBB5091308.1 hypothetical protein [Pseudochrobactrum saccharolyticum]MDP8250777.1 hypothetical protein [Pseudochrobactrum saccharolyticum]MDP8250804.1 hypothetical protein [Pseudochrobactrum saccharolyticum]
MTGTHTTAHIPAEAVRAAIKSFESTDNNCETYQDMRKALAAALPHLSAPCAVSAPTKEERHENTSRNHIINQTSTDLEQIINGHDPDQSILNNDVWDRLDKMACEIEALAKPVDVAAVREKVAREICLSYGQDPDDYASLCDICGSNNEPLPQWHMYIEQAEAAIRALSPAEPAQGEQLPQERVCIPDPHDSSARIVGFRIREGDAAWGEYGLSEPLFWLGKLIPAAPNSEAGK